MNFRLMTYTRVLLSIFSIVLSALTLFSQTQIERADKFLAMNDVQVASTLYFDILDKDENNVAAMRGLAESYYILNQPQRAHSIFNRYYQTKPEPSSIDLLYARNLMILEKYDEAITFLEKIISFDEPSVKNLINKCVFAQSNRDCENEYNINLAPFSSEGLDFYPLPIDKKITFLTVREDKDAAKGPLVDFTKPRMFVSEWGEKIYFSKALNNNIPTNLGPVSYHANGKKVAVTKNKFQPGQRIIGDNLLEMSLFLGKLESGNMINGLTAFPYNEFGVSNGFATFADDKTIYFSSNRLGGYGGFDIYKSVFMNGKWSLPVNLGPNVNSPGDEISPVVVDDILYFASDYFEGYGGFDLFRVVNVAGEYEDRKNLGKGINSSYDDYSIWFDQNTNFGYLSTNRPGGKGNSDIYTIRKITKDVNILVMDETTQKPIPGVLIDFSSCGEPTFASNNKGICSFKAKEHFDCHLMVSKVGYTKSSLHVNYNKINGIAKSFNIFLKRIGQFSTGKVIDKSSGLPVQGAYIEFINKSTNESQTQYTALNGAFEMYIEPNQNYEVKIEADGYEIYSSVFNPRSDVPSSSFHTFELSRPGEYVEKQESMVMPRANYYASIDTIPLSTQEAKNKGRINILIGRGHAIQLASVATDEINFDYFKHLNDYGRVYVIQERGLSKVRLGVYASQDEAKQVLNKVRVQKEFSDAFLVHQAEEVFGFVALPDNESAKVKQETKPAPSQKEVVKNEPKKESVPEPKNTESKQEVKRPDPVKSEPAKQEEKVVVKQEPVQTTKEVEEKPAQKPAVTTNTPAGRTEVGTAEGDMEYLIRLAAYLDVKYFDDSKIEHLGEIRTFVSGDYTVMLLKGYHNIEKAREVKSKAIEAGFAGAQIVVYKDKLLLRIE